MSTISPFKFLDAYNKDDKDIFFGRDAEIEELYSLVFESNLTLVYGQSGTGKSSLIQCGLANRFAQSDWFNVYIRRNDNINESMLSVLKKYKVRNEGSSALVERLKKRRKNISASTEEHTQTNNEPDESLKTILRRLYKHYLKPVYLIFDQFEELFILGKKEEQQAFYENIADILETELYCRVILIMREEVIAELYDFEKVVPVLFDKRIRVEQMSRSKTQEVITRTTGKFDIQLDDESLPDRIIEVLSEGEGRVELTYLQVFLDRLYQEAARGNGSEITFTSSQIEKLGTIEDVLGDYLNTQTREIQNKLSEKNLKVPSGAVKTLLSSFVTLEGTKRPVSREQIMAKSLSVKDIDFVVDLLERSRIIRHEGNVYELSHDALAHQIASQRSTDEIAIMRTVKLVKDRYSAFEATKTLLNANELNLINIYQQTLKEEGRFTSEEEKFIRKSSVANRKRRLRLIATTLGAIAVLIAFSIYSNAMRIKAEESEKEFRVVNYDRFYEKGINDMENSNYTGAVEAFEFALSFADGEDSVRLKGLIDESKEKALREKDFMDLIAFGDNLLKENIDTLYVDAREKYREALDLGFDDNLAQTKLSAMEGKLDIAYNNFILTGNTVYETRSIQGYKSALKRYGYAMDIKVDSFYLQRMKEIEQILMNQTEDPGAQ